MIPSVTSDTTFTVTANFAGGNPAIATSSIDIRSGADPMSLEETVLADNPSAYYRFEESSSEARVLLDHSPNANDSISIEGEPAPGQPGAVGNAWHFDGSSIQLDLNPDPAAGDLSVALAVRVDQAGLGGTNSLVGQQDVDGTGRSILSDTRLRQ